MKNTNYTLSIFLFFLLSSCFLNAQNSFPLFNDDVRWNMRECSFIGCIPAVYHYQSDTVFNGYTYSFIKKGNAYVRGEGPRTYVSRNGNEKLLYDFSLLPGDSVVVAFKEPDSMMMHVDQRDTVQYFGKSRTRLKMKFFGNCGLDSMYWVEGIGSLTDPFYFSRLIDPCLTDIFFILVCADSAKNLIYRAEGDQCYSICAAPEDPFTSDVTATSAKLHWSFQSSASGYVIQYRELGSSSWIMKAVNNNALQKTLHGLVPSATYEWRVKSKCGFHHNPHNPYTPIQTFTTNALKESQVMLEGPASIMLYPNPADASVTISGIAEVSNITISDLTGRIVKSGLYIPGTVFKIDDLPADVYLLTVENQGDLKTMELLVR